MAGKNGSEIPKPKKVKHPKTKRSNSGRRKPPFSFGGVISKYPDSFRTLINELKDSKNIEVYIITDMHKREETLSMLEMNDIQVKQENVHNSDFETYGEACKAVLLKQLGIDIHIDDFPAYISEGCPVRLLVLPDLSRPYYDDSWKTPNNVVLIRIPLKNKDQN